MPSKVPKPGKDGDVQWTPPTPKQLENAFYKEVTDIANKFGRECTKVISKPRPWAGFSNSRDIVDTGQLRASQKLDYYPEDLAVEVSYNTQYAAAVHNGATIQYSNGSVRTIPPRPWMKIAADSMDLEKQMEDKLIEVMQKML